jgi:hypothetical protein
LPRCSASWKLSIRARSSGVFVYTDPDDWAGRPVQTGERIGLLADPTKLGVRAGRLRRNPPT